MRHVLLPFTGLTVHTDSFTAYNHNDNNNDNNNNNNNNNLIQAKIYEIWSPINKSNNNNNSNNSN